MRSPYQAMSTTLMTADMALKIAPSYYVDADGTLVLRSFDLVFDPNRKDREGLKESKEDQC